MRLAIEELIQKWLAENPNERLPGAGQPLDLDEYFRWPEELRLAYSLLKSSGHVPEEVQLVREIDDLKQRLAKATDAAGRKDLERRIQEQEVALDIKLERHRRR
jgi:DnaJ-like protein